MTQTLASAFLTGCGAETPLTLEVAGPAGPAEPRTFRIPSVLIGSHERSDLRLEGERVSRRHAYLQWFGDKVFCLDLASRTGVSWPEGLRTRGWLEPGRPIRVGPYQITLPRSPRAPENGHGGALFFPGAESPSGVHDPLEERVEDVIRMPRVLVEIKDQAGAKKRWRMTRRMAVIGRWSASKVRLRDGSVSRFHAALVRTPLGVWVVDLLGRGGTHLNGRPIRWELIRDGDRLAVGRFLLRFWYEGPAPSSWEEREAGAPASPAEPAPAAFPVVAAGSHPDSAGSLLLPVMDQFKVMHQNMFEQFQQTLLLLVQMFSTMHQDQVGLVRQELDAYQQATVELRALQEQLRRQESVPDAPKREAPRSAPARWAESPPPKPRGDSAAPAAERPPPRPAKPAGDKGPEEGTPAAHGPQPDERTAEVHAWLSQRIADLQQERQGRWQRILGFVLGK